ncbi:GATA zinc finger domain-containing protein 24-like [Calliphora vicina]|uniref:GATA zinc finger domain-containing protein 24-like n=1 Tax=Calliphora vicina TaxID=7373 RepID=UPI00325A8093
MHICTEIVNLTRSLENAYISDGLSCELASKYSTQVAVKALAKNCTIDKVKLIMEAGQFNSMNEAVSKFVNSCTEATGQQNAILYYGQRQNNYDRRRDYNRNNNNFYANNDFKNPNSNGNNTNDSNRNRWRRGNNRGSYVRAANLSDSDLENPNTP